MLKNDFGPKVYSNDMIIFFLKHILLPIRNHTNICESMIDDYVRIDEIFKGTSTRVPLVMT